MWDAIDRIAASLAILTVLGGVATAFLKRHHIFSTSADKTDLLVAIGCLTIVGMGAAIGGWRKRQNIDNIFDGDRGRSGTYVLLLGVALLLGALAGLLAL